jgi:hypothetical protein
MAITVEKDEKVDVQKDFVWLIPFMPFGNVT